MLTSPDDYAFFYEGLQHHELLIQRCRDCKALRNPPAPCCPHCRSFEWAAEPMSGEAWLYSYTVHHHPPLWGFDSPHPVGLVTLKEGVRFVAALLVGRLDEISIGMPVKARFLKRNDVATVCFEPELLR